MSRFGASLAKPAEFRRKANKMRVGNGRTLFQKTYCIVSGRESFFVDVVVGFESHVELVLRRVDGQRHSRSAVSAFLVGL